MPVFFCLGKEMPCGLWHRQWGVDGEYLQREPWCCRDVENQTAIQKREKYTDWQIVKHRFIPEQTPTIGSFTQRWSPADPGPMLDSSPCLLNTSTTACIPQRSMGKQIPRNHHWIWEWGIHESLHAKSVSQRVLCHCTLHKSQSPEVTCLLEET